MNKQQALKQINFCIEVLEQLKKNIDTSPWNVINKTAVNRCRQVVNKTLLEVEREGGNA